MDFISCLYSHVLYSGINQPIEYEGVALKSFFLPAPDSCLFLNKFEHLIVSSQMLF